MYSSPSKSPLKAGGIPYRPGQHSAQSSPRTVQAWPVKACPRSAQTSHVAGVGVDKPLAGSRASTSPIPQHCVQSAYKQAVINAYLDLPISPEIMKHSGRKHFALPKAFDIDHIRMTKEPSRNLLRSFSNELGAVHEDLGDHYVGLFCDYTALPPTSEELKPSLRMSISPPPVELIDAVMTGDVLSGIIERVSRQDMGSLRLTCKRWSAAIGKKVTALQPALVPPSNLGDRFPATSKLDLTSLGAKRFRSIKGSMLSCKDTLTSLEIGDNRHGGGSWLCNQDMHTLSNLHKLQSLKIFNPKSMTQQGIENLSQLRELEALVIDKCKSLSVSLMRTCTLWPTLKTLRLGGCKLHKAHQHSSDFEDGHGLRDLFLRSCSIQAPGFLEICSFKSLQSLRIEKSILDCPVACPALGQLSSLAALTDLKIVNVSVDPQVLCSILSRLPHLKCLKVIHTSSPVREVTGFMECLAAMENLEDVDVEGLKLPWTVLDRLLSVRTLTMSCPASDSPVPDVAKAAKLQTLVCRNMKQNAKMPNFLKQLKALTTVVVCVETCEEKNMVLRNSLAQLMSQQCRVLMYEYDNTVSKWKPVPVS